MTKVEGSVERGFEQVADAFRENFTLRDEVGAACCVSVDGVPVVDIWGGRSDAASGRAWEEDTLALVFSASKGARRSRPRSSPS